VRLVVVAAVALLAAGCGGSKGDGALAVDIQVVKHGRQVLALVPVTINGRGPYTFALDTGASQSLVDSQVARDLGVEQTGDSHRVAGITDVANVQAIKVAHWRVGAIELPSTTVVEANLPFGNARGGVQGLLGSDMLSEFDVVTIDYAHEQLRLHHRP
jgi:predicted aspartyl protease